MGLVGLGLQLQINDLYFNIDTKWVKTSDSGSAVFLLTEGNAKINIDVSLENNEIIDGVSMSSCEINIMDQSKLTMKATMHLKRFMGFLFGGKIRKTVAEGLPESLNELKIYAETGEPSEAKKERQRELARNH